MEIEGEKILKRIKKVPLWTWIGYVICVIVIGVAISSIDSKERTQKPEPIDLTTNGGIGIEENKYAYLEIQGLSDEVAIYGNQDEKNDSTNDRYYVAINGGYWYVVDLNFETIDKLKDIQEYTYSTDENAVIPETVKIYGMTEKIPDELKKMFVDFYNQGLDDEEKISLENFEAHFGSVLLNVRRTPIDTNFEDGFIILAVLGIFVLFVIQIVFIISKNKIQKYISKNRYKEELINQLENCVEEKHYKDRIILTKDFFVDYKSSNGAVFKYSDIKWVHIHNIKYYGVMTVSSSIIVHLRDGKTQMKCVEIKGKSNEEFLDIFNKICDKAPADCLKGYTKENLQEFKQYKKDLKK